MHRIEELCVIKKENFERITENTSNNTPVSPMQEGFVAVSFQ